MAKATVRTHARKTASGKVTQVKQHTAARKHGLSARRGLRNLKKAVRAGKRKKHGVAAALVTAAVVELVAWTALRGAGVLFVVITVLCSSVAGAALAASKR